MNTETGEILSPEEYKKLQAKYLLESNAVELNKWVPMEAKPTAQQLSRKPPRVGRNDMCPCGSGKKFKKCCLNKK